MYSPERMVYLEKTSGVAVAVGSVGKQRSAIRSKKSGFTNVTERVMKYIYRVWDHSGSVRPDDNNLYDNIGCSRHRKNRLDRFSVR